MNTTARPDPVTLDPGPQYCAGPHSLSGHVFQGPLSLNSGPDGQPGPPFLLCGRCGGTRELKAPEPPRIALATSLVNA